MSGPPPVPWLRPAPFDGTARSLAEHAEAIGAMLRGEARMWLGPFPPPAILPAGFEQTALVVPTSGSTGAAKAVALSVSALVASQDATARRLGDDDPQVGHGLWLPLLAPTHIAGIQVIARACRAAEVRGLSAALLPGALPALAAHFDARSFTAAAAPALADADAFGVPAFTSLVPTQLARLLGDRSAVGARALELLGRFAAVLVGGAATSPSVLRRARDAGIAVRTTYGSSETAGGCVYDGVALDGVRLRVEEPADQEASAATRTGPPDATGRLVICSPTLALGYLRERGPADLGPFRTSPTGREFVTSDLARLTDGTLQILGRADDVIVTGGRKVLPQDVERALDAHPDLDGRLAGRAVVGVPDPEWGERIIALIVPAAGAGAAERGMLPELVTAALRHSALPAHAVPKAVHIIEHIPLLGIGKIDRAAARRLACTR